MIIRGLTRIQGGSGLRVEELEFFNIRKKLEYLLDKKPDTFTYFSISRPVINNF